MTYEDGKQCFLYLQPPTVSQTVGALRGWDKERFLVIIRSVHFLFVCIENGGKLEYNEHVSISQIGGVSNGLSFR